MQFYDYQFRFHKYGENNVAYEISDMDESGDTKYYGYLAHSGAWIIMAWDTTENTFRYASGKDGYAAAWTARASQDYGYYSQI